MRKYVIGLIAGIVLSFTFSTQAAEIQSLIGRAIEGEFPVKIKGATLEKPAIVIDGTSYLPVRAIGDALNLAVSFDADLGIELKEKEAAPMPTPTQQLTQTNAPTQSTPPLTKYSYMSVTEIQNEIKVQRDTINSLNDTLAYYDVKYKDDPEIKASAAVAGTIKGINDAKQKLELYIAELQAELESRK